MIRQICVLIAVCLLGCTAQASSWPPSSDHPQQLLWPGTPPDPLAVSGPEHIAKHPSTADAVSYTEITNVAQSTLTLYKPRYGNTKAAVLVFPGGGYWTLAIDLEGTEACDWLTANGITCVLVKYRVKTYDQNAASRSGPYPDSSVALEDSQRAIAITRFHAREWGIDPHKIGVLGFSAGGHLVAATSTHPRIYKSTDAVDATSVRPDFGISLYPGHLWADENSFTLNPDVPVDSKVPPQLIIQSGDDPVDDVNNSLVYYAALRKAGVSTEMHIYSEGGHAFGLRHTSKAITDWPALAIRWLKSINMIAEPFRKP